MCTCVRWRLTHKHITVLFIGMILTVCITVAHPGFTDAPCRVLAAKLDIGVACLCHAIAVLLITCIHTICVSITAPAVRYAEAIQAALKLICMATSRGSSSLVGAVGMCLIAVVPAVVVPVTSPVLWDAAATITLELGARTRVTAAILIAVVSAVIIIIAAPIYVNTSAIGTGELSKRETGRVGTFR